MPDKANFLTNGPAVERALRQLGKDVADGTDVLLELDRATKADLGREMGKGKATGGRVRGRQQAGFADQYTRKTDGAVVPAWGDVRRLHGRGVVKGKKRPSGKRIRRTSIVNQDTGRFRAALVAARAKIQNKGTLLIIGGKGVLPHYAEHILRLRPLLFWTPADKRRYRRLTIAKIRKAVKRAERRAQR